MSPVPLGQGRWDGNALTVPCDKAALYDAPHHDPDVAITTADEEYLYRHYGLSTASPAHGEPGERAAVTWRETRELRGVLPPRPAHWHEQHE